MFKLSDKKIITILCYKKLAYLDQCVHDIVCLCSKSAFLLVPKAGLGSVVVVFPA